MHRASRWSRRAFVTAAATAPLAAAMPRRASAAVEYRLTHPADITHPVHVEAEAMARRIQERTNNEVRIRLFPNNALGSPVETAQQTRLGAIDMILGNPANLEPISRTIGVINIPYQFDGWEHAHRTLDTTGRDWLSQQFRSAGFHWISSFEWGFRAFTNSRRPVNAPADIQGLRVRVPPELAIRAAFEALGASTHTIAFQEVYLALSNRTVDGQDNPVATVFAGKFFEVQSHLALTRHIYAPIVLLANPRAWGRMNGDQQAVVTEEAVRAGRAARQAVRTQEEDYIAQMQRAGIQVTRPDVGPFRERMGPAYDQLRRALGDQVWTTWEGLVNSARQAA